MDEPNLISLNEYYQAYDDYNRKYNGFLNYFNNNMQGTFFCADNHTIYALTNLKSAYSFIKEKAGCQQAYQALIQNMAKDGIKASKISSKIESEDIEWVLENSDLYYFSTYEKAQQFFIENALSNDIYDLEKW